jgi:hypothetical protein
MSDMLRCRSPSSMGVEFVYALTTNAAQPAGQPTRSAA